MKLHIFNPEHDLALAANQPNYTAPHAGRQLRNDLSFIPALWADEGDLVLVDDIDSAQDKIRHFGSLYINKVEFITKLQLQEVFRSTMLVDSVHPWGWDKALVSELKALGCPEIMLPQSHLLDQIRNLSSRRWAAENLQRGVLFVDDVDSLRHILQDKGRAVVKAPWSCSGRGVRYFSCDSSMAVADGLTSGGNLDAFMRWASNIIKNQGGVTVEPYYNKVKDFGMEFEVRDGKVNYRGLSLFQTIKGAYTGNILATEEEKVEMLQPYVSQAELIEIRNKIVEKVQPVVRSVYGGPFGVDMMICADGDGKLFVNPCVELNLRRTMGHVALSLGPSEKASLHIMRVEFDGNKYRLKVLPGQPSEDAPLH